MQLPVRYFSVILAFFLSTFSYAQSNTTETLRKEYILQGQAGVFEVSILKITSINAGTTSRVVRIEGRDKVGVFPMNELPSVVKGMRWILSQKDSVTNNPELKCITSTHVEFGAFWNSTTATWGYYIDFDNQTSSQLQFTNLDTFTELIAIFEKIIGENKLR